ncbi:MAG: O-antigen ligase family protein [Crocinitomicaceae bacterium]|nr:O-antigen ligase family protein [Crocinitomicaceae bacterium]
MAVLQKIFPWTLFSIGLVLIVRDQLIAPFIILSFIASFGFWKIPSFDKKLLPAIGLMVLFCWYLIGLSFSDNLTYGWKDIESKLSFFLFPLILIMTYRSWDNRIVQLMKNGIIAGVLISMLLSFGRAFLCKINGGELCFRNNLFGFNMHATYLSVIYILSVFFVFERKWGFKREILLKIAFLLVALAGIYFMRSLSSFVATAVLIGGSFLWFVISNRKWTYLILIPLAVTVGVLTIKRLPAISGEINTTTAILKDYSKDPDSFIRRKVNWNESNTVRIVVWNFSLGIIANHPMGVGTGDVKDQLNAVYRKNGYTLFAENQLNTHNQFFQTGIALGIGGMIVLFLVILGPVFLTFRKPDPIIWVFVTLIFITCLFESYLERQAGIIFFSFVLVSLLANNLFLKEDNK